jgi:hypothetical protein
MNRRAAKATVSEAEKQLPALPATDVGLVALVKLERETTSSLALLTEKERQAFAAMLADNRTRIARGILEARVSAIGDLPAREESLDQLNRLLAEVDASALAAEEKTSASSKVRDRAQAIVAVLVADAGQRAATAPASLQGLAETTKVIREIDALEQRASKYGRSAAEPGAGPVTARRIAILADFGVQDAFRNAMLAVARKSASPTAVQSAATRLLQAGEMEVAAGASPYRAGIDAAMQEAEKEHRSRVLGTDVAAAPPPDAAPSVATGVSGSVSGEPAAGDMLDALEALASGIDAAQDNLAGRCARPEVRNDPGLAVMCLVQMGAGGPMHVHVFK